MAAGEFKGEDTNNAQGEDQETFGYFSTRYDYVTKGLTGDEDYPSDAWDPWLHYNMRIGNVQVDEDVAIGGMLDVIQDITAYANITATGTVKASVIDGDLGKFASVAAPFKQFDIPHPNKQGMRLRHACIEGPEVGVYYRGRLVGENVIHLPDYWDNLIDPETITVSFTPHTYYQELFVKSIEWGKKINVMNNIGGGIDCSYIIYAERKDVGKLQIEYKEDVNNG